MHASVPALLLLIAFSFSAYNVVKAQDDGTELSCAITIWGNQDYEWNVTQVRKTSLGLVKNYTSHCIESVKMARQRCGGKGLNFVITQFWKYTNEMGEPGRFCYKTNIGDDQVAVQCTDLVDWYPQNKTTTKNLVYRFYKGMKGCFITALWEGFTTLKITPHLDDGTGQGGWRNLLRLDPNKQLDGYSYSDVMLRPLARALNESIVQTGSQKTAKVYFTLQGEMNLALASYPLEWKKAVDEARWTLAGFDEDRKANVKVGVSMNFNKLCGSGCNGGGGFTTAAVNPAVLAAIKMNDYKDLLYYVDYLGISNYPKLGATYQSGNWDMESAARDLNDEMAQAFGFNLMDYINMGKEFHLSEFGVGGGQSQCGCEVAGSVQQLADYTFFGLFGIYGHFEDPWQRQDFRDFRKNFYKHAIWWLANKGGPNFKVSGAYIWCMSSWDVAGLYWTSTSDKGSYYDEEVMAMIRDWNDNRKQPGY